MKKIKFLSLISIPSLVIISPLVLCQCSNNGPSVDPSVSNKVNITTTIDNDGNSVNKLTTKESTDEIVDIKVTIGTQILNSDEYKVEGLSSNGSVTVTIYKAALNKYTGQIVIKPTVHSQEAELTSITAICTKTFYVGDSIKSSDITIKGVYSDGYTKTLTWNASDGYEIYIGETLINDFNVGYQLTTKGSITFKVVSKLNSSIKQEFSVNVIKNITVKFTGINGTVSKSQLTIEEGKTWGNIKSQISAKAEYGYKQNSLMWKSSESQLTDDTILTNGMTITALFAELRPTAEGSEKTHDTLTSTRVSSLGGYMPEENKSDGYYSAKGVEYDNDTKYTFTIELGTITNIKYFWIYDCANYQTFKFADKNCILSVKDENGDDINYSIIPYSKGNYFQFNPVRSSGSIKIQIAFHEGDGTQKLSLLPVYEKGEEEKTRD